MYKWVIVGAIILFIGILLWWRWRWWYRSFQRRFLVKLPFIAIVVYNKDKEKDKILWGVTRYRFIRKDGRKDNRHSMNIRWPYPTTLILRNYKVKIWNLDEARRVFREVSVYMDMPLKYFTFEGQIDEDLFKHFKGSNVLFVRYCLKLFEFYGWEVEVSGYSGCNGIARNGTEMYAIHCVLRQSPMVLNDVVALPSVAKGLQWIVIGNGKVSNGARAYAREHNIYLMDKECIRKTFVYEEPQFL